MSDPVFEQMLDGALDSPEIMAAIDVAGAEPSREELRVRALEARDVLLGVAAAEYDRYRDLRAAAVDRHRLPRRDDRTEGGFLPGLAVLVPSLGVVATGVFLLCGFGLRALTVRPHFDEGLVMAGVIAAAVTAGAALGDLAWRLAARARGGDGDDPAERDPGVRQARDAWERAVVERGLVPFLLDRVEAGRVAEGRVVGAEERVQ
ncbi:hypothetical protein [Streptomyces colonosanans]|uniref:Uncharacterized protein n=1 Tax=Streptomyces colonosanans TaxID=1428652 RepID=A0A1S2PMK9_9ACTN|nr:hypothetical protein [Streptomyces colonosanans]OIJ94852.1 hypothetical protein BIV24_10075 [Streptomyces colonosanans]